MIRDNYQHGTVGEFLKDTLLPDSEVAIVSAYFTLYAYHALKNRLDGIEHLRFLFGEPTFIHANDSKLHYRDFKIEDEQLVIALKERLSQHQIAKQCADWLRAKADIRSMVKPNFLHGKLYHITQASGIEKAIVGSSNFTVNGLGLGGSKNIELNVIIDSDRDRAALKAWFDKLWNDETGLVQDVKAEVLRYLEQFYRDNSPQFIYLKTLYHLFADTIAEQENNLAIAEKIGFYDTQIWQCLYDFQKDGVKAAINKIIKHNGCIIADSVGLGKTFEALAVIKYFECRGDRVLLICPKNLSNNWTLYQARQNHAANSLKKDRFDYTVLHHTDLGRTTGKSSANGIALSNFHWGAYDLVVIDESHNFRGNPLEKTTANGDKVLNRAKWLLDEIIKSGVKTKVLLLSATPVNNNLRDLSNQIALITEGKEDALSDFQIKNITQTLKTAQNQFTNWADAKKNPQRNMKQLLATLDAGFFTILNELTIARSRRHIQHFYDLEAEIGQFPERNKPLSVYVDIDTEHGFPSYEVLNQQILGYKLAIFNPSAYLKVEQQAKYHATLGKQREHNLVGMMQVNFLKRLESSIASFTLSLKRTIAKIADIEHKIIAFQGGQALPDSQAEPDLQNQAKLDLLLDDELDEDWVGQKLKFNLADLELDNWLFDLRQDQLALKTLLKNALTITPERDAKLHKLKCLISEKIAQPINADNKKIIIFTAFADTAIYLHEHLSAWYASEFNLHCALICGNSTKTSYGKNDYNSILTHFSPRAKQRTGIETAEIDLLIATDCISEGQNLQDCDYLINYDIHWNPVRIIQRFGRIDRLGSQNTCIQLVNFWPTKELDNYINLKARVEARMALVDASATGEDNLLTIEEEIDSELKYRHQQLEKLKHEVLDLEDMDESLSLTDFNLADFKHELLNQFDNQRQQLLNAPLGLYALVSAQNGMPSGVIFCLRQTAQHDNNQKINPLTPYFLVYIGDNGTVHYHYSHVKQILEIFKTLCDDKEHACETLCQLFNQQTQNGADMSHYSELLNLAVAELVTVVKNKGQQSVLSGRGGVLMPEKKQVNSLADFELITWLIIHGGQALPDSQAKPDLQP